MAIIEQTVDGVLIAIKVIPNASKDELSGVIGERLKVRVKSPPQSGKANIAVCQLLAKAIGVKKNAVSIISGNTNHKKIVGILGVSEDIARSKLDGSAPK